MKKILAIAFMLMTFSTYAQNLPSTAVSKTMTGGTLTNSGTTYVTLAVTSFYEVCSFQVVCTKVSGTLNGYVSLQYSNDGTNYIEVDITDTLHISNQTTNSKIWVITHNKAAYYRLACVGRTTQSITCAGYFQGEGQRDTKLARTMLSNYNLTSDTITNTGSGYVQFELKSYYEKVSIQPVVTRLSGTAAGTVTLQGSNDGTNFVTMSSSYTSATTMSVTNVTTSTALLTITSSPYRYYRLSYTGSGTMSCRLQGYLSASN